MKNHKIEFKFYVQTYAYDLPLIGVDLEFLAERRREIVSCITQISPRIAEINIATMRGAEEFELAAKVIRWYHDALRVINHKTYYINNPNMYDKDKMLDTERQLWIDAASRRD